MLDESAGSNNDVYSQQNSRRIVLKKIEVKKTRYRQKDCKKLITG